MAAAAAAAGEVVGAETAAGVAGKPVGLVCPVKLEEGVVRCGEHWDKLGT